MICHSMLKKKDANNANHLFIQKGRQSIEGPDEECILIRSDGLKKGVTSIFYILHSTLPDSRLDLRNG